MYEATANIIIPDIYLYISGSQIFDEEWWTIVIESGTGWTLNQSNEFKVMNSFSNPRPKTEDKHCWYFIPGINIKEDEDIYAFNGILVEHDANSSGRLEE
jgi:hypothetical protein